MDRELKTILCGTDFTEHSNQALDYALRFAKLADGVLIVAHFVHVQSGELQKPEGGTRKIGEASEIARAQLAEVHRGRLEGYAKTELVVDVGAPAELLIKLAEERHVDVIVTASQGRSELADLLLGSVAEKLIRHAPCPVLVVRQGVA